MEEEKEFQVDDFIQDEEEEKKEVKEKPLSKKAPLLLKVLTFALLALTVGGVGTAFTTLIFRQANESSSGNYLTFDSKSISECSEIYGQFGREKQKKGGDFAFLGSKLFYSESKITPQLLQKAYLNQDYTSLVGKGKNLYLYSLSSSISRESGMQSDFTNGNFFIDFKNVPKGDYLIYSDTSTSIERKDFNPYSLSYQGIIDYLVYTLPDENGVRKSVRLRNNPSSPFTLITVRNVDNIVPDDYYDAVIFDAQYSKEEDKFVGPKAPSNQDRLSILATLANTIKSNDRFKVKVVDSLQSAINVRASHSFALQSDESISLTSLYLQHQYTSYSIETLSESDLSHYDAYPEVREMLGYLGKAGENYEGVVGNDTYKVSDTHIGKQPFLLHTSEDLSSTLLAILEQ